MRNIAVDNLLMDWFDIATKSLYAIDYYYVDGIGGLYPQCPPDMPCILAIPLSLSCKSHPESNLIVGDFN